MNSSMLLSKTSMLKEALKSSIFVVQKGAAPKNGVEFCQRPNGTISSSLATSYNVLRRRPMSPTFDQSEAWKLSQTDTHKHTQNLHTVRLAAPAKTDASICSSLILADLFWMKSLISKKFCVKIFAGAARRAGPDSILILCGSVFCVR